MRRPVSWSVILILAVAGAWARGAAQAPSAQAGPAGVTPPASGPPSPVYVSLFTSLDDHLNIEITEERLVRVLQMVETLGRRSPTSRPTCLVLFSGAVSDAFYERDAATHLLGRVKEGVKAGTLDAGYDGNQEPTFVMRPRPNFRGARTGEQRWLAREQAADWFLTEYKNPITGEPDPDRPGGLKRAAEVLGSLAYATGVAQDIGGDSEVVHVLRRLGLDPVLQGVPENTTFSARLLAGFGGSALGTGRAMSPEPGFVPEMFWMDNVLRLSDTSGAPVKVFVANQGPEALQKILDGLDWSRPHVIRVQLAHPSIYLKPGFGGGRHTTPLEWAYDNPRAAHLGADGIQARDQIDAAYAREEAVLAWLTDAYFTANPGSRFVSLGELKRSARPAVGQSVGLETLRGAAAAFLDEWTAIGNYPPGSARSGDQDFSIADMFQMLATALARRAAGGADEGPVTLRHVYGPLETTDETGPAGKVVRVRDVVTAAATLAPALSRDTWKPLPDNAVPTWVDVGNIRVNSAEFLRLMAEALLAAEPDTELTTRISYMSTPVAESFPKSRKRSELGPLWTLKPARLTGLQ